MNRRVEMERETHTRRMEVLTRRLEKLNRDILDTEIQIDNERLIGEELATKTRRFGLLGMIDDNDASAPEDDAEAPAELSEVAEVEASELAPA